MKGESIQHFIDSGDTLEIWCHTCRHHAKIDLLQLRDRLGPDHGSMHDDLIHLFRCSKCGEKRQLGLLRSPDLAKAKPQWGVSAYQKAKGL